MNQRRHPLPQLKRRRRLWLPLAAATALAATGVTAHATVTASTSASATDAPRSHRASAQSPAEEVLRLVNEERKSAGCDPVQAHPVLTRAADAYSDVMAETGELSHTGPDGSGPGERVTRAGYEWSAVGENIARGQDDAADVMQAWMNSPGHRKNILNCAYRDMGLGVETQSGGPWWTQVFATTARTR